MTFKKGDPRINRNGRPKNAEPELLRKALEKEGERRGENFWDKVAQFAFTDRKVMIAVLKKFVPDMTISDVNATLTFNKTPKIIINGQEMEYDIGNRITEHSEEADPSPN